MNKTLLFVGEDNPYGSDPKYALWHIPMHASGNRLRKHLGLRASTWVSLGRINLCDGKWSMPAARAAAGVILSHGWGVVVMLGAKVRHAFGAAADGIPFFGLRRHEARTWLALLPHPSGRNLLWNDPAAPARAMNLVREIAPWVPWGEVDETRPPAPGSGDERNADAFERVLNGRWRDPA